MKRLFVALLLAGAVFIGGRTTGGEPDGGPVKELMRLKLERAQTVLAAIVKGDFEGVQSAAGRLGALSQAAAWRISDDRNYTRFTLAFRRSTDDLSKAAAARDIDAATSAYIRMTRTCVQCHKLARHKRMVSLELGKAASLGSSQRALRGEPLERELAESGDELSGPGQE